MKRKRSPLSKLANEDKVAKAKVAAVLEVLSGEKTISKACQESGLKPIAYYKLEERMVQAMLAAASMPPRRGKRRDPAAEASWLAEETETLRQEHRRLSALMRVSNKLFRTRLRKTKLGRPPKTAPTSSPAGKIPQPSTQG